MPFFFPSNPTLNQQSTQNGRVYTWTGSAWELASNFGLIPASNTFEIISKNIKSYPSSMSYDNNGSLLSITYTTNNGNIIKTFNRDINNKIVSITLSGSLPSGISTTKNFTYLDDNLVAISYS